MNTNVAPKWCTDRLDQISGLHCKMVHGLDLIEVRSFANKITFWKTVRLPVGNSRNLGRSAPLS